MSEERMRILRMLECGQIKAKEAADLLHALERPPAAYGPAAGHGRWMRVMVTDTATGKRKINVTVPMGLVDVALRAGAHFTPKAAGVDPQEILDALRSGERGKIVDAEDDKSGEHVEIYVD